MNTLKRNLIFGIAALCLLVLISGMLILQQSTRVQAASVDFPLPVSINGLMVTLIDHSAHYIWDYGNLEDMMMEEEWQAVEYYSIQLAASGPLITLGGTGQFDNAWVSSPLWLDYAMAMSDAAMKALDATRIQDQELLITAGNELLDSCLGCHEAFKPDAPSEGLTHEPLYDRLYHLFER